MSRTWIVVAVCVTAACSAKTSAKGEPPRTSFLRWNFDQGFVDRRRPEYTICNARSVSWVDEADAVKWTTALPKRMSDADSELCECRRVDDGGPCAAEHQEYLRHPRGMSPGFVIGMQDLGEAVIVADGVGLLALRKSDGAIRLDRALAYDQSRRFFVDRGDYAIEGDATCRGEMTRGQLFARCGDRLLYFNGSTAALLRASDLSVLAIGTFDGTKDPASTKPVSTRIRLGNEWLRLEGIVWL